MKHRVVRFVLGAVVSLAAIRPADAAVIFETDYVWTDTESTISTRIVRNGDGTTWANFPEPFAGTIASGSFRFTTFSVAVGAANFLRLTLTDPVVSGPGTYNAMIAGYQGSFNPGDLSLNWLGDPGLSSGFPPISKSFEVIAPQHSTLVVLLYQINSLTAIAGSISHVRVDAFLDANETEPPPAVPEPTSMLLLGSGLGAVWLRKRRASNP